MSAIGRGEGVRNWSKLQMDTTKKLPGCQKYRKIVNVVYGWYTGNLFFRLFSIISISQKIFSIFFLTLEKIGIDKKVIYYHNISN